MPGIAFDEAATIKANVEYYTTFCEQSSQMQIILSSFASSLQTSMMLLPSSAAFTASFDTRELEEVKEKAYGVMRKMKEKMESQVQVLNEVTKYVGKASLEFRKMVDLMKYENERSGLTLMSLQHQLKLKDKEIQDCQNDFQNESTKKLQQDWTRKHYINRNTQHNFSDTGNKDYMKLLKQFRNKVELQISFEKEEMIVLSANISVKLKEFKNKLLEVWALIGSNEGNKLAISREVLETRNDDKYTELEREYLKKERRLDGFDFEKMGSIKRKLKLMEEADMSQSRQFFTCMPYEYADSKSNSKDRPRMQESEVVGLINLT